MSLLDLFRRRPRRHGWLTDPSDKRDAPLAALQLDIEDLPPSVSLRHPAVTVRDQDGTSSCVAFAWASALELAYAWHDELIGDVSTMAIYFWARASHGNAGVDAGTHIRSAAKTVARFGIPTEKTWPFSPRRINHSPPWQTYRDGFDRRGQRGYYSVLASDVMGIKRALASGKPVVGGWYVDRAFTEFRGTSLIDASTGPVIGGHAMAIVGYNEHGDFDLLNSWGTAWGNLGYCRVTETFIRQGHDLWAIDVQPH